MLSRERRQAVAMFVFGLALLAWGAWLLGWIPTYAEYCEQNPQTHQKECATHHIFLIALWQIGKALDAAAPAITAIATGFIAWFTLTLKGATDRLWDAGERQLELIRSNAAEQSSDMKASIAVAKNAADAAKRAADAAEQALTGLERPWLFIEGATIVRREPPGAPIIPNNWFIAFRCRNVGRSPAVIHECLVKFHDKDTLPPEPDYAGAIPIDTPRWISVNDPFDTRQLGPSPEHAVKDGQPIIFVAFGRLTYTELNGKIHHTGFAVEVSPHMAAFSGCANDAYDYYD
jgi:hypothetical protein